MPKKKYVVWQFSDGKPGHQNQANGLISALSAKITIEQHIVTIPTTAFGFLKSLLFGKLYHQLNSLPTADYLIAVGRRTHLPMLFAHLWFGGKRILLMRSSWPQRWFDLMIIPQHDNPKPSPRTLVTYGVMNTVIANNAKRVPTKGLMLIGGPSKHFNWNSSQIIEQLKYILDHSDDIHWTIANSRRTPASFENKLREKIKNTHFIDHAHTSSNWLSDQLVTSQHVWVSPDSVSMLYEAITSGAYVGILELDTKTQTRVINGINELITVKHITPFKHWQSSFTFQHPNSSLNEAQRAANWILNHE
jgi:mitochondrial fission protein ELM1